MMQYPNLGELLAVHTKLKNMIAAYKHPTYMFGLTGREAFAYIPSKAEANCC